MQPLYSQFKLYDEVYTIPLEVIPHWNRSTDQTNFKIKLNLIDKEGNKIVRSKMICEIHEVTQEIIDSEVPKFINHFKALGYTIIPRTVKELKIKDFPNVHLNNFIYQRVVDNKLNLYFCSTDLEQNIHTVSRVVRTEIEAIKVIQELTYIKTVLETNGYTIRYRLVPDLTPSKTVMNKYKRKMVGYPDIILPPTVYCDKCKKRLYIAYGTSIETIHSKHIGFSYNNLTKEEIQTAIKSLELTSLSFKNKGYFVRGLDRKLVLKKNIKNYPEIIIPDGIRVTGTSLYFEYMKTIDKKQRVTKNIKDLTKVGVLSVIKLLVEKMDDLQRLGYQVYGR